MRPRIKIVTIAAPKGGSGKSTVTGILAARAVQEGYRVALFDLNADQASLTQWWISRGEPNNPYLYEVENLTQDRYRIDAVWWSGQRDARAQLDRFGSAGRSPALDR